MPRNSASNPRSEVIVQTSSQAWINAAASAPSAITSARPSRCSRLGSTAPFRKPATTSGCGLKTITASAAKKLGAFLTKDFRRIFGATHDDLGERLGALARSTIECLARSDALYHNYEHTFQVTLVGRDILQGMALAHRIEPEDYAHLIVACLLHDIGYMRGVLSGDTADEFIIDDAGNTVELPRGG